ncbi:MAG: hydroxyacylglutathione hydrolase [Methylotenera sp.]
MHTSQLHILPIPALVDNYIWLLHNNRNAVVVDPSDADPVIRALSRFRLTLSAILITHHHADHIDGVETLLDYQSVPVYAPKYENFKFKHTTVEEGSNVHLDSINLDLRVWWLPGHTLGHIAYLNDRYLFCGDILFSAGCGRLFEGSPAQMLHSLNRLKNLDPMTKVFCTHEYTSKNIEFALTLEPENTALHARKAEVKQLRKDNQASLPSTIKQELEINPFLRCREPSIIKNSGAENDDELSVFTKIRKLRNHY